MCMHSKLGALAPRSYGEIEVQRAGNVTTRSRALLLYDHILPNESSRNEPEYQAIKISLANYK